MKKGKGQEMTDREALYKNARWGRPYYGTLEELMKPYCYDVTKGKEELAKQFGFHDADYVIYLDVVTPLKDMSIQMVDDAINRYMVEYRERHDIPEDLCDDNYYEICQAIRVIKEFGLQEIRLVYYYDVIDYFKYAKGVEIDDVFRDRIEYTPPENIIDRTLIDKAIKKAIQEVRKHPELYERPKLD